MVAWSRWMECMDRSEENLLQRGIEFLRQYDRESAEALDAECKRVVGIAKMARNFPSLLSNSTYAVGADAPSRLVKMLCSIESGMSSLNMPVRAVMGSAFLTGKVHLFNSLLQKLNAHADTVSQDLLQKAKDEVSRTTYTMLLATLLWDLIRNKANRDEIRTRAATELVRLWETPDKLKIADFFPVLEAVWRARNRVKVNYGSLVGVTEFFQLVREDCPPLFISFFTGMVSQKKKALHSRSSCLAFPVRNWNVCARRWCKKVSRP